jgi:hypothetical protein
MSLTYSQTVTTLANLLALPESNTDFLQVLPTAIDYAENRINNQFSFLSTIAVNSTASLSANNRAFTLPTPSEGTYSIIENLNLVIAGTRTPLTPVSRSVLDTFYPTNTATSVSAVPSVFCMVTDQSILVGPAPGATTTVEVVGLVQPAPLSASNPTTYISTTYPELLIAACMVFLSGWQKNFSASSDSPQQAISWESNYQMLAANVDAVDARQKFEGASWTPKSATPFATRERG